MKAVEFAIELTGEKVLAIPPEVAAQLPSQGRARVIILTARDSADADWQRAAYEQFLRDDSPEDAVYDTY